MRSTTKKEAFTLIELLVVISVIALLLSILIPAISKVKEHAKRTLCISNIHQLLLGCQMYGTEYNEYLPMGNIWNDEEKEEGWLDVSYQMAKVMNEDYDITEDTAMCQAWKSEQDNFFYEPTNVSDNNFKVGGTKIGYIYYGRRFDEEGSLYSPVMENGEVYKSPSKFSDKGTRRATSDTLLSCFHWDSISSGGNWGAKIPHAKNARGHFYEPGSELIPEPKGLATGNLGRIC